MVPVPLPLVTLDQFPCSLLFYPDNWKIPSNFLFYKSIKYGSVWTFSFLILTFHLSPFCFPLMSRNLKQFRLPKIFVLLFAPFFKESHNNLFTLALQGSTCVKGLALFAITILIVNFQNQSKWSVADGPYLHLIWQRLQIAVPSFFNYPTTTTCELNWLVFWPIKILLVDTQMSLSKQKANPDHKSGYYLFPLCCSAWKFVLDSGYLFAPGEAVIVVVTGLQDLWTYKTNNRSFIVSTGC